MVLPTGTISMSQVNTELGRSSTASISLGETAVRTLAGVASGAISMNDLRGKSAGATYTPAGGTSGSPTAVSGTGGPNASASITASQSVTWTYTRTSGTFGSANVTSGSAASSITFSITGNNTFNIRTSVWSVSASDGSTTKYWTVTVQNTGLN